MCLTSTATVVPEVWDLGLQGVDRGPQQRLEQPMVEVLLLVSSSHRALGRSVRRSNIRWIRRGTGGTPKIQAPGWMLDQIPPEIRDIRLLLAQLHQQRFDVCARDAAPSQATGPSVALRTWLQSSVQKLLDTVAPPDPTTRQHLRSRHLVRCRVSSCWSPQQGGGLITPTVLSRPFAVNAYVLLKPTLLWERELAPPLRAQGEGLG